MEWIFALLGLVIAYAFRAYSIQHRDESGCEYQTLDKPEKVLTTIDEYQELRVVENKPY